MGRALEKARWFANRLAAMSPAEVAFRIRQAAFRRSVRTKDFSSQFKSSSHLLPVLPGLRESIISMVQNGRFCEVAKQETAAILHGPFRGLGKTWPQDPMDTRWHRDPHSGRLWPMDDFCFDIDFRHRNGLGDPKYVWQYNKLQHLHWPAVWASISGEASAARFCVAEIESWIRANPPFKGINWASGVECAMRVLAITIAGTLIPAEYWQQPTLGALNECLAAHGYWLEKNLSLHSSANNHLIVELAGLFLLSVSLPGLPAAQRWRQLSQFSLERECRLQFAADGGSREQSPSYGAWSMEWLGLCAAVAKYSEPAFAPPAIERLQRAAAAISSMMDDERHVPRIGDDDDATALIWNGTRNNWISAVCSMVRALPGTDSTIPVPDREPAVLSAFGQTRLSLQVANTFQHFPDSGYTVVRKQQENATTMVVFDHGPLGYLSIAAHGHADALAIWIHRGGKPLIVDSGTYAYGADPDARSYFRSTAAHNTLTINNQSSSHMTGPFNWSQRATCRVLSVDPEGCFISAEHDGFPGARHERRIKLETGVTVSDLVSGNSPGDTVDIRFLLAPELDARLSEGRIMVFNAGTHVMTVTARGPMSWVTQADGQVARNGWYSPAMGERVPACMLHLTGHMASGEEQTTQFDFA